MNADAEPSLHTRENDAKTINLDLFKAIILVCSPDDRFTLQSLKKYLLAFVNADAARKRQLPRKLGGQKETFEAIRLRLCKDIR